MRFSGIQDKQLRKPTTNQILRTLMLSFVVLVAAVLWRAADTVKIWMICSVLASVTLPTLVAYIFLDKEYKNRTISKSDVTNMKIYHWQSYRWKYLFIDSELILIGIILGLDTIGDLANTLVSVNSTALNGTAYGENTLAASPFTLIVLLLIEVFVIIYMTLTYGIDTKETFSRVLSHSEGGPIRDMAPIYDRQLLTIFTLFFGNLVYLVLVQNFLSTV